MCSVPATTMQQRSRDSLPHRQSSSFPSIEKVELGAVHLDAERLPGRSADRPAEDQVVREDHVGREVVADRRGVGVDEALALLPRDVLHPSRLEILVAIDDEDRQEPADLRSDEGGAAEVVPLRVRILGEDGDLVPEPRPRSRERARVDIRARSTKEVAMPEENLHAWMMIIDSIRRAAQGDTRAFERLVVEHQHRLYTLAARELGSRSDADDAVQETLIRAWRGLPRFRAEASFSTWLYRICLNAISDQRSRRSRAAAQALDDVAEPADPRDRIAERELSDALQHALAQLDENYRTPVLLYDVLGRSYGEIAEVLDVAEGTVKSRIFRGRAELARLLGTTTAGEESND